MQQENDVMGDESAWS